MQLTHRLPPNDTVPVAFTLSLTADERTRSRHYFVTDEGQGVHLRLDRGTVLRDGDLLQSGDHKTLVRVIAKPEPTMVVTAQTPLELLRAAYHLGNRHVPLEVTPHYLRLAPDPVLQSMLLQMGIQVHDEVAPFSPEAGAYGQPMSTSPAHHHHNHSHSHSHP